MEPSLGERTGVLVVRIWIEAPFAAGSGLRARITSRHDIGGDETHTAAAASVEQVVEIVREWVDRFVADDPLRIEDG